jgi:hypothetical protein
VASPNFGRNNMEVKMLTKELMISAPALAIYIAGMRLGFFPRFRLVAVDIAVVLLQLLVQLLGIKELLRMYLDFYAAYFFKREHNMEFSGLPAGTPGWQITKNL